MGKNFLRYENEGIINNIDNTGYLSLKNHTIKIEKKNYHKIANFFFFF